MIGTRVFVFDPTHHVYPPGVLGAAPIWVEHWVEATIVGETTRSWVTDLAGRRFPKQGPMPKGFAPDRKTVERIDWMRSMRHMLGDKVEALKDYETFAAVARLVGWSPP